MIDGVSAYKVVAACSTYLRPELLKSSLAYFNAQTWPDRELWILDDAGQYIPIETEQVHLISQDDRFESLSIKRNTLLQRIFESVPDPSRTICMTWDDDDVYLPWAMEAVALAFHRNPDAVWAVPSMAIEWFNIPLQKTISQYRHDIRVLSYKRFRHSGSPAYVVVSTQRTPHDKYSAYGGSWAFRLDKFIELGGFPNTLTSGDDIVLSVKLLSENILPIDSVHPTKGPWYIYNRDPKVIHISDLRQKDAYLHMPKAPLIEKKVRLEPAKLPKWYMPWPQRTYNPSPRPF